MKAVILAAGEGTRMMPLTSKTPKPLLPVAGKPILQHTVDALVDRVDEIIIVVGWYAKKLKDTLDDSKVNITYAKQSKLLGTADAISKAKEYVGGDFICINGDLIIFEEVLHSFIDRFKEGEESVIGTVRVPNPESYGVIKTEGDYVKAIIEKPKEPESNLINAGIYGFRQNIFDAIEKTERSSRGEYEITDSLKFLMDENKLKNFEIQKEGWIELSRPWELLDANKKLLEDKKFEIKKEGTIEKGAHVEGDVSIGKGSILRQGTYIQGPVIIGKDCDIGPNCLIRPSTILGDNCKVGNAVEVKNSIIMDNTKVPHHNYVGDSILGKNCNLGSGTKVANLRLDENNIVVFHRGEYIDTRRRKLGVIMGDDVKTGINSMINVGTIVGEGTFIGPGALAEGDIGPNSKIQ